MTGSLSIRHWLVLMGGMAVALLLLLGGLSLFNAQKLNQVVDEASDISMSVRRQMDADMMHDTIRSDVLDALLAAVDGHADKADGAKRDLDGHIQRLEKNIRDNAAAKLPAAALKQSEMIRPVMDRYTNTARQIVAAAFSNLAAARARMPDFDKDFDALETEMEVLSDLIQAHSSEIEAISAATLSLNLYQVGAALLASLLLMVPIALHLIKRISMPLERLAEGARTIERTGDLSVRVAAGNDDELGHTVAAFNSLMDSLQGIVRDVRASSTRILDNSGALAATAGQTARASEQSSEAAASMAATMEQLSVSIDHMSAHAQLASEASVSSGALSRDGEAVVAKAAAEMRQIADSVRASSEAIQTLGASAEQISNIVSVIKEIADQTNLLALNAAIEAARAGEQGRGFAVVADEVRKLAERTAKSTEEISVMIGAIQNGTRNAVAAMNTGVERVEQGVELAGQAGATMEKVAGSAVHAENAVGEMSRSLREQSAAGQAIARSVEQVAQVSDQSHAAASESSRRAQELAQLAQALDEAVQRFRT